MPQTPAPAPETSAPDKLRLVEKLSYGLGDFASCLYWQTFMLYLTFFYTDVFGISALAAGTMIGASRFADAFFDPVMGMLADRTKTRWGKFRPFFVWMCAPMAVLGVLTFTTPHVSMGGKLVWAIVTYNLLMLVYTAINIPYTALMGVITTNPAERTTLSSIKYVGAFAGGAVVNASLLKMAQAHGWLGAATVERGWQLSFVLYGIAACVLFITMFFTTRERVVPPKVEATTVMGDVRRDLGDLVTNVPWITLVASTLAFILFVALRSSVTVHYFKYFVGSQPMTLPSFLPARFAGTHTYDWESLASMYNTVTQIVSLTGVVLMPFMARLTGRKMAFMILITVAICCTGSFYFLRPDQVLLIFALNMLGSIAGGPIIALLMTMYADSADYGEWKQQRRATGLIFSASIFSQKMGWALGAWAALSILGAMGYVANVAQTPSTLHGLVMLVSVLPAGLGILSMVILMFYPLNEHRMAEIEVELKKRRAAAAQAAAT